MFEEGLTQHLNAKRNCRACGSSPPTSTAWYRAPREPAAQLLEDLLGAIRYAPAWLFEHCDTRVRPIKWSNVRRLRRLAGSKGEEDGKNPSRYRPSR